MIRNLPLALSLLLSQLARGQTPEWFADITPNSGLKSVLGAKVVSLENKFKTKESLARKLTDFQGINFQ